MAKLIAFGESAIVRKFNSREGPAGTRNVHGPSESDHGRLLKLFEAVQSFRDTRDCAPGPELLGRRTRNCWPLPVPPARRNMRSVQETDTWIYSSRRPESIAPTRRV